MAQRGRRAQQRHIKNIVFASLIVLVCIAAAGAGVAYMLNQPRLLDATTLCPAGGPRGHYVLLVDKTDPLTPIQRQAFAVTLQELFERRIPEGYLLSVFALGEDFRENTQPTIELCNPGDGTGKSELTSNLKKLRSQYESRFLQPMLKQTDELVATTPAKSSPILEMLQLVGINGFRRHDIKGERRLIILSDMLHNTPQFTMYRGTPDYNAFESTDYGRKRLADLRGVDIELHYVMNTPALQVRRNLQFWEDHFVKAGARVREARQLEG